MCTRIFFIHLYRYVLVLPCFITLQKKENMQDKEVSLNKTCTFTCGNVTEGTNVTWNAPDNISLPAQRTVNYTFRDIANGFGTWSCYYRNKSHIHLQVLITRGSGDSETWEPSHSPRHSTSPTSAAASFRVGGVTVTTASSASPPWSVASVPVALLTASALIWCLYKRRRRGRRDAQPPHYRLDPVGSALIDLRSDPNSNGPRCSSGDGGDDDKADNTNTRPAAEGSEHKCLSGYDDGTAV